MMRKEMYLRFILLCSLLAMAGMNLVGCRYALNRTHDFADIFQIGAGVTAENPVSGMAPPSLGIHAQVTEFINLGAIHFTGLVAEWDGRGFFVGPETRTRFGFLPMQLISIGQDYASGYESYFKNPDSLWSDRMNSLAMRFAGAPAKGLDYVFWADRLHQGAPLFHRGWQYWENISLEVAISEPFFTHLGVHLRLGVDVSEISDLLLGFFILDFKHDDLTYEEYDEMIGADKPDSDAEVTVIQKRTETETGEIAAPGDLEEITVIETRTTAPVQSEDGDNAPTTQY